VVRRLSAIAIFNALFAASACLDDLDPAKSCPPEAKHAAQDCGQIFETLKGQPGQCLYQPEQVACLAGKRKSCDCQPDECPVAPDACYPPGDCPPEVVKEVGSEAKCMRLAPADFSNFWPQIYNCECGCIGCAAVCDGFGPVIGVWDDGQANLHGLPIINIKRHMPKSGRFGVYIRARGLSNAGIAVVPGDPNDSASLFNELTTEVKNGTAVIYYLVTPLDSFAPSVFFDQHFIGQGHAYAWSSADDEPAVIMIFPPKGVSNNPAASLFEIDCVIPFVLPR
jgi:hypothetical protein